MKNFGKLSLEDFKKEFSSKEKEVLMEELTGGILGSCHCCGTPHSGPGSDVGHIRNCNGG